GRELQTAPVEAYDFLRLRGSLLSIDAEIRVSPRRRSARNSVNPLSFHSILMRWHALHHSGREKPDDLIGNLRGLRAHVDGQRILARIRFFERVDLALQQRRRHEMTVASLQMLGGETAAAA